MTHQAAPTRADRFPEARALHAMFTMRPYRVAYLPLAAAVAGLYALLLPGLLFGTLQPWVLRFLTPLEAAFALGMGALLPLALLLNVFLWKHAACALGTASKSTAASLLAGLVPNALCCTPLIPTMLSLFLSGPALVAVSAPVQQALGTYAGLLYAASLLALWGALRVAARRWARGGERRGATGAVGAP